MYDDLRGWDTDPYLGPSECYNNFGKFDVRISMPSGWLVGATGVLHNPTEVLTPTAGERLSHVLESDSTRNVVSASEFGPGNATVASDQLVWHFVADTVNVWPRDTVAVAAVAAGGRGGRGAAGGSRCN